MCHTLYTPLCTHLFVHTFCCTRLYVHLFVHACMYTPICTRSYLHTYLYTPVRTHIFVCACTYTPICTRLYAHTFICACTYTPICTRLYAHTYLYMLACRPSFDWMRNMSVRNTSNVRLCNNTSRRVTLVFNNLQPAELAEQLTFLEFKAFRRITVSWTLLLRSYLSDVMSSRRRDHASVKHQSVVAIVQSFIWLLLSDVAGSAPVPDQSLFYDV